MLAYFKMNSAEQSFNGLDQNLLELKFPIPCRVFGPNPFQRIIVSHCHQSGWGFEIQAPPTLKHVVNPLIATPDSALHAERNNPFVLLNSGKKRAEICGRSIEQYK